jgi:hypothetical protein
MATEVELIQDLREMLADDDPEKNILNQKKQAYSDTKLRFFLKQALRDVNAGSPRTTYSLEDMPEPDLLVLGGMIFSLIAEGILQLRNQLDYSDAGLSISMFNKTGGYQGWAGFLLQSYITGKTDFKRGVLAHSPGAGFYGIRSQFSTDWFY